MSLRSRSRASERKGERVKRRTVTKQWCTWDSGDQQRVKMKRNSCGGNEFPHPFCKERRTKQQQLPYSHFGNTDFKDNKVHSSHSVMPAKTGRRQQRQGIGSPEQERKAQYLIGKVTLSASNSSDSIQRDIYMQDMHCNVVPTSDNC